VEGGAELIPEFAGMLPNGFPNILQDASSTAGYPLLTKKLQCRQIFNMSHDRDNMSAKSKKPSTK